MTWCAPMRCDGRRRHIDSRWLLSTIKGRDKLLNISNDKTGSSSSISSAMEENIDERFDTS